MLLLSGVSTVICCPSLSTSTSVTILLEEDTNEEALSELSSLPCSLTAYNATPCYIVDCLLNCFIILIYFYLWYLCSSSGTSSEFLFLDSETSGLLLSIYFSRIWFEFPEFNFLSLSDLLIFFLLVLLNNVLVRLKSFLFSELFESLLISWLIDFKFS